MKRLGHEANDALDEFLELALGYERKAPASLQGFMAWLRAADLEVKRDMEISRDEVRVMTVHGAKGLEAPVVFLVDTTSSPSDTQRLKLIHLPRGNAEPHAPGVVVWATVEICMGRSSFERSFTWKVAPSGPVLAKCTLTET